MCSPFAMSDLTKCILVLACVAGMWFFKDYRGGQTRKFHSEAGQQLSVLQGNMPAEGKPVVLEFWGTYCGPCLQSIPHLNQLHTKFRGKVQFIAVSGEDPSTVRNFLKRGSIGYPVAVDIAGDFFKAWSVRGVPTTVFLDGNQNEKWRGHPMELTDAKLASLAGLGSPASAAR